VNGAPKIAATATAIRPCSSSNAGVGAGVLLGQVSGSVVRLHAAANRAASKHFDDSRSRGIAGLRGGVLDGRDEPAIRRASWWRNPGQLQAPAAGLVRPAASAEQCSLRLAGATQSGSLPVVRDRMVRSAAKIVVDVPCASFAHLVVYLLLDRLAD
jgi:hypothetical protein